MEKLHFDSGIKSYKLGAGVLRFHPGDPNVYARFLEGVQKLRQVEAGLAETEDPTAFLAALQTADREMKRILDWIFGQGNDFEQMLSGVNLLAVAENGERVATNLFTALEPVLLEGAKRCAGAVTEQAVQKAKARRQSQ